jgi:hypothetical protein
MYKYSGEVMSERTSRIMIKLDIPESIIDYYCLHERWENEGGAISTLPIEDLIPRDKIPFAPGDYFRIIDSRIDLIDHRFYYIAEIQKVPGQTEVKKSTTTA